MSPLDENANCAQTYASFRLAGDALMTADVSRRLGIEPRFAAERGMARVSGGATITQRTGVWYISTDGDLDTTSVERHLLALLDRIEPVAGELEALIEDRGLHADFFCYWRSATGHGGPELSPETLRRIADLGAVVGFDFYGPFADEGVKA